jgi:hemerythrin-like domain-containing protein
MTTARELTGERAFVEHEHRELAHGINRIHEVACSVGTVPALELSRALREVMEWVDGVLRPHAAWEEQWLYPELDLRAGTPWATRLLRFDHGQIRQMTSQLDHDHTRLFEFGHLGGETPSIRCHLFGLEALLRTHLEREETFLLPLLEQPHETASAV